MESNLQKFVKEKKHEEAQGWKSMSGNQLAEFHHKWRRQATEMLVSSLRLDSSVPSYVLWVDDGKLKKCALSDWKKGVEFVSKCNWRKIAIEEAFLTVSINGGHHVVEGTSTFHINGFGYPIEPSNEYKTAFAADIAASKILSLGIDIKTLFAKSALLKEYLECNAFELALGDDDECSYIKFVYIDKVGHLKSKRYRGLEAFLVCWKLLNSSRPFAVHTYPRGVERFNGFGPILMMRETPSYLRKHCIAKDELPENIRKQLEEIDEEESEQAQSGAKNEFCCSVYETEQYYIVEYDTGEDEYECCTRDYFLFSLDGESQAVFCFAF